MTTMMPQIDINQFILIFLGLAVGAVSGFVGVGGGLIVTPALIILGIPAYLSVGTSMLWVMGNAFVGTIRHQQEGNVDFKLAVITTVFVILGIEIGVRLLNYSKSTGLTDIWVLCISFFILLVIGSYMLKESTSSNANMRINPLNKTGKSFFDNFSLSSISPKVLFKKSCTNISLFSLIGMSLLVGILAGFIGVGGGFIMVPVMIYIWKIPTYTAVGTNMLQMIFSAAFGSARHVMSGNVLVYPSILLLLGSSLGIQIGAQATRYLKGRCMRFVLANTIFVGTLSSILKVVNAAFENAGALLDVVTKIVIFGGLVILVLFIMILLFGRQYFKRHGIFSDLFRSLYKE